jgi:hypothetical protein
MPSDESPKIVACAFVCGDQLTTGEAMKTGVSYRRASGDRACRLDLARRYCARRSLTRTDPWPVHLLGPATYILGPRCGGAFSLLAHRVIPKALLAASWGIPESRRG